jgi:hypothetical protein
MGEMKREKTTRKLRTRPHSKDNRGNEDNAKRSTQDHSVTTRPRAKASALAHHTASRRLDATPRGAPDIK